MSDIVALGPLRVTVVRYRCPHCGRTRAKKANVATHIDRCWLNPLARGCKTCTHFQEAGGGCGEYYCNCASDEHCYAHVDLTDGLKVGCPQWEAADGAD